jgi:hypothetical protein
MLLRCNGLGPTSDVNREKEEKKLVVLSKLGCLATYAGLHANRAGAWKHRLLHFTTLPRPRDSVIFQDPVVTP